MLLCGWCLVSGGFQGVAIQLLRYSTLLRCFMQLPGWYCTTGKYLTCYYGVAKEFGWLPDCCYAVAKIFYKVFWVVARVTLYNWTVFNVTMGLPVSLGDFQGVATQLLKYSTLLRCFRWLPGWHCTTGKCLTCYYGVAKEFGWFPGCCYTAAKIFYIAKVFHSVARVMLFNWKVFNMLLCGC